jgi:hypothetical protein
MDAGANRHETDSAGRSATADGVEAASLPSSITRRKDPISKTHPLYALYATSAQRHTLRRYRAWLETRA